MTIGAGLWEGPFRSALTAFAKTAAIPYYRMRLRRFEGLLEQARTVQRARLLEKIRRCANSRFGREHHFAKITTVDDFRRQVPISPYEHFAPYIDDVSRGRLDALFPPQEQVYAFACTTGTTGKPKLNPVTRSWLREYLRSWEVWGVKSIVEHSEMIGNKVLQLTGPGDLDRSPSGLPIGMVSSIASRFQNPIYRSFYAVPPEVGDISDSISKYYTTQRLAMSSPVGFIVAITPANLIRLAEVGHEYRERLIRDIHDGTLSHAMNVPPRLREKLAGFIRVKRPHRARMLEQTAERTGTLYPKDYWPLSLIACWLGGTIGYQSRDLSRFYGTVATRDLGLVSTEGRHTIPLHDARPEGVLAIDGSFYEFIPAEEHGSPGARVLEGFELQPGHEYYIVMTTSSGLYRYDIGDVVRCQGFVGQAPVLEFLHKEGQCADMEGEKISAYQVAQAVEVASRELGVHLDCFTATPVRRNGTVPYYALLIERPAFEDVSTARQFLQLVDRELIRQNVMYAGKRNDLYIDSPQLVRLLPGTWSAYMTNEHIRSGTGDSQYKHPALIPDTSWLDRFEATDTITVERDLTARLGHD